jgi:hypothetical protein
MKKTIISAVVFASMFVVGAVPNAQARQCSNASLEGAYGFLDARPDGLHDLGSRDEIPWPLNQHAENVERARTDRHRSENTALIPPEQNTSAPVETEALEQGTLGRGECVHLPPPICSPVFLRF